MKIKHCIYSIICLATFASSCSKEYELSTQNRGLQKPSVTIEMTGLTDNSLTFEVRPSEEAAQYAYVVLDGKDNETPDPRDILFKNVTGAKEEEAFNVKDKPIATVEMRCTSTESYQIFASAITAAGLVGDVVELPVTVPDTTIPVPHKFTYNGNTITIEFFEPVKRGNTGRVMVRHMKETTREVMDDLEYLTEDDIKFSDGNVVITCPRPSNGTAYGSVFILSYEAGAFVDYSGNDCEAFWSKYNELNNTYTGFCWQDDHVNFSILPSYFTTYGEDHDWSVDNPTLQLTFPFDVYDSGLNEPIQVIYSELDGLKTIYVENYTLGEDRRTLSIVLPKKPEGYFDVSIKAGAFYDVWGNEANAFSPDVENLRYQVEMPEPKYGRYMIDFPEKPFEAKFERYDNNHVVIYANWFNIWEEGHGNPILMGVINKARRTITFDGTFYNEGNFTGGAFGRGLYFYDEAHNYMLAFWGSGKTGEDPIVMRYDADGYITSTTSFEYAIHETVSAVEAGSYGKVTDGTSLTFITDGL